jgi:hypothetical protein
MTTLTAVVGSTKIGRTIDWVDEADGIVSLSGATITGTLKDHLTGVIRAIDGGLAVVGDGTAGQFTWAYGSADVGTAGRYLAQFTATYPDAKVNRSKAVEFYVYPSREVAD